MLQTLLLSTTPGQHSLLSIVTALLVTFVLSLIIVYVYRRTHQGMTYSQSFVVTLIIISLLTTVVMIAIAGNLAYAFGLLGAFSIIRFRTPLKETKDTGYIFFALSEGLVVGVVLEFFEDEHDRTL